MGRMSELEVQGVALGWDPDHRLLHMEFRDARRPSELAARTLAQAAARWLEDAPGPFALLVDCSRIDDTTPGWRAVWAEFFRRHKAQASVAWYNANALIRVTVLVFVKATGVRGAAFRTEADARAWLASVGTVAP